MTISAPSVALPGRDYLAHIGAATYCVAYLEAGIVGDLPCIPGVPPEITWQALAWESTGAIGEALITHSRSVTHVIDQRWLRTAGDVLQKVAGRRNKFLHARAATHPGGAQRLIRDAPDEMAKVDQPARRLRKAERFWIDESWIDEFLAFVAQQQLRLPESNRPAVRYGHVPCITP